MAPAKRPIETEAATVFIGDDQILRVVFKPISSVSETHAREVVAATRAIGAAFPLRPLVDLRMLQSISRDALVYLNGPDTSKDTELTALIIGSAIGRIVISFAKLVNRPPFPVEAFSNEQDALHWIASFDNKTQYDPTIKEESILTTTGEVFRRADGMIFAIATGDKHQTLENAQENAEAIAKIAGNSKRLIMVDVRNIPGVTKEAQAYYSNGRHSPHIKKMALLVGSLASRIIGNLFIGLYKSPHPIHLFTRQDDAEVWLKENTLLQHALENPRDQLQNSGGLFHLRLFQALNALMLLVGLAIAQHLWKHEAPELGVTVGAGFFIGFILFGLLTRRTQSQLTQWYHYVDSRQAEISQVLLSYAGRNFAPKIHLNRTSDILEALALGVNILGDELAASTVGKDYFDSVLNCMGEMLFVTDSNGKITLANKNAETLLGVSAGELVGADISSLLALETTFPGRTPTPEETAFLSRDGNIIPTATTRTELSSATGDKLGFVYVARDISTEKRYQAERRLQSLLAENAKMAALGHMAGGMAHEINNPLAAIKLRTELTLRKLDQGSATVETVKEDLKKIGETTARIAAIISGLLHFSRNAEHDQMTVTDISKVIQETLALCREKFNSSGIDLRVSEPEKIHINCRGTQISQVILNILNNSYDAIQNLTVRWVEIIIEEGNGRVLLKFTDSGTGIHPEARARIMEPFFTTKEIGQGTGLGLSISRGIIEAHGGTLQLNPKSANTQFVINLPLASDSDSKVT